MTGIQPQVDFRVNPGLLAQDRALTDNQPMVANLGSRIKEELRKAKRTQTWLASNLGVSDQAVTKWVKTGKVSRDKLLKVAAALQLTLDQLIHGDRMTNTPADHNVQIGPEVRGKVPLISWVQAGTWTAIVDNFHPGAADEWVDTTVPIHRHTYALRVKGDSMTNPNGDPSFPDGSVIIIEPDAVDGPDKLVGSFVIVKRVTDNEATFKQLVKDAGCFYLKPLNPRYPMIELRTDDVLCGVVRERVMRFF